jgi:hypothetical protein
MRDYDDHETFKDKDFHKLRLPAAKSGSHEIRHIKKPKGTTLPTSSMRTAFLGQQPRCDLTFGYPTRWHELSYDGGVWMTDYPIEQIQHDVVLEPVFGDILVGGLGIGYAVRSLIDNPEVGKVTVVEISQDVADLVWPYIEHQGGDVELVVADLHKWLATEDPGTYDWCFFDIWQSDGESTFWEHVSPLRRLVQEGRFCKDDRVVCWNEDVMRGQLRNGLQSRLIFANQATAELMTPKGCRKQPSVKALAIPTEDANFSRYWNWSCPFFAAIERGDLTEDEGMKLVGWYAGNIGRPDFESAWLAKVAS